MKVEIKLDRKDLMPTRGSAHAAGYDLRAACADSITLKPGERQLIPTGVSMALPENYEAQIRPRSGLAYKHGITVLNTPGTIDADYRGEIKVILINLGQENFEVTPNMRIAQMVIAPVSVPELIEVDNLPETVRSAGGFGSTGH